MGAWSRFDGTGSALGLSVPPPVPAKTQTQTPGRQRSYRVPPPNAEMDITDSSSMADADGANSMLPSAGHGVPVSTVGHGSYTTSEAPATQGHAGGGYPSPYGQSAPYSQQQYPTYPNSPQAQQASYPSDPAVAYGIPTMAANAGTRTSAGTGAGRTEDGHSLYAASNYNHDYSYGGSSPLYAQNEPALAESRPGSPNPSPFADPSRDGHGRASTESHGLTPSLEAEMWEFGAANAQRGPSPVYGLAGPAYVGGGSGSGSGARVASVYAAGDAYGGMA
ncbi:hypothetical protein C8R46DRAFT_1071323 [Mycena filopes]|nr:hypothetical protein C8R46DRAFT_1071323 [Mycena filopes]